MDEVFRLLDFRVPAARLSSNLARPGQKRQREFITPEHWEVYFPPEMPTAANLKLMAAVLGNDLSPSAGNTTAAKHSASVEHPGSSVDRGATVPSASVSSTMRLDYKACLETHRANNKKPLLQCVSALSREQHRFFRDAVITAMTTGSAPESLLDGEMLLDIVHREQMAYLAKWKELMVSCPLCNLERHKAKAAGGDLEVRSDNEHECLNHNFLPPGIEAHVNAILQRKRAAVLSEPLRSQEVAGGAAQELTIREEDERGLLGEPPQGDSVAEKCAAPLCDNESLAAPLTVFPPSHKLVLGGGVETQQQQQLRAVSSSELKDPFAFSVVQDEFDNYVCLSFRSIVDLACCLVPGSPDLHIPILVDDNMSLYLQENCPATIRRRELLEEICLGAIEADQALPLARLEKVQILFSLPLATDEAGNAERRQVLMRSHVWRNSDNDRITVPLIKMEYSAHKTYNVEHDDESELHLEEFSKRELISMHLALSLHPQSQVTVFRVDAYTMAVVGVQSLTPSSFLSASVGWNDDDKFLRTAWGTARRVLDWLRGVQVASLLPSDSVRHKLLLRCAAGSRRLVLSPTAAEASGSSVVGTVQVERSSRDVSLREYLPPMVWPYADRIPYTFAPKSVADEEPISRLKSVRDARKYAAHDVWSHSSTVFRSSMVGNMVMTTLATKSIGRSAQTS